MFNNGLFWCWYLLLVYNGTDPTIAIVSTACYGSQGFGCTEHKLICTEPLFMSITNITFGYRSGCSRQGISSCGNTACCREETGDCFTPYDQTLLSQLQQTCNGRSTCTLNSNQLNEVSLRCFTARTTIIYHSYSKIEYQCSADPPSSTPRLTSETTVSTKFPSSTLTYHQEASTSTKTTGPATDINNESDADVGGIVGSVVGVILFIAIVGAVIFFIKRRKADKKPAKNVHVNQNDSNRQYQTDTTSPRTTATPIYYELEKSTYSSRPNSERPTSGISGVTSDDEYHHLKGTNSNTPSVPDSNYNHIGSFSTAEDNYQHIGDSKSRIITEDTYNHIDGHDNPGLDSDDYNHIDGSQEHQVVTDGTYNHIGSDHNEILGNDEYNHIGNGNTQPIITDGEYAHIGGADA